MLRFLQLSDVRLGAPPRTHAGRAVPAALRAEMRQDGLRAVASAVGIARDRAADALLIAGGLTAPEAAPEDVEALWRILESSTLPVLAAPGAADPATPGGYLHRATAELLGVPHPANLTVVDPGVPVPLGGASLMIAPHLTDLDGPADAPCDWIAAGGRAGPEVRARGGWAGAAVPHRLPGPGGTALVIEIEGGVARAEVVAIAPRSGFLIDLEVSRVARAQDLTAHAARALADAGAGAADLAWFCVRGAWRHAAVPRLDALPVAHAELLLEDVAFALPGGASAFDLHVRTLAAGTRGAGADRGIEALRLALAAWRGEEVSPDEDPEDRV